MVALLRGLPTTARLLAGATATALFVGVGAAGTYRYVRDYWLYRGFPPPRDPAFVTSAGHVERFYVTSPALGGRHQPVDVYLPPGYDSSRSAATRSSISCTASRAGRGPSSRRFAWGSSR